MPEPITRGVFEAIKRLSLTNQNMSFGSPSLMRMPKSPLTSGSGRSASRRRRAALRGTLLWLLGTCGAAAQDSSEFAATPGRNLRAMTTDRPDATESPFTIDPGHVQIEMDFARFGRNRDVVREVDAWEAAPFNLRVGLSPQWEAGVFIVPFQSETVTMDGGRERRSGFGDTVLRAKWNARGNDGGDLGFGLIADVKLPTASDDFTNGKIEGGLTLPISFPLVGGWSGGAMTSIEAVYSEAGSFRAVWSNTITAGRELGRNWGGFIELTSSTGDSSHAATFNCGITRRIGTDTQWDAGANFGLSRAAEDVVVFSGVSRRF